MILSADKLRLIMPRCPRDDYAELLGNAMDASDIATVTRAAMFLGQIAHESGELRWLEERGDTSYLELRPDLGNIEHGDGAKFHGRGFIQITGRDNYRAAGNALDLDLTEEPWQASDPDVAARIAAWYWVSRGCNALADTLNFIAVTRAINGGLNGLEQRTSFYHRALEVLGRGAAL